MAKAKSSTALSKAPRHGSLAKYNPVKGLLLRHAAKEAEKRARRARDVEALYAAIERKLTEEADFIFWWDTEAERRHREDSSPGTGRGNKGVKASHINATSFLAPEDFNLTIAQLSKWRTRLNDSDKFKKTLEEEKERARRRLEFDVSVVQARRAQTADAIRRQVSLPDAKYRVIYADPPWQYSNRLDEAMPGTTVPDTHYPTMSIDALCQLDVIGLCEDNAVMFLWVTSPLLYEAAPVIDAWGFTYKTSFVWDKVKHNVGHYNSVRHEFLLVCTRGTCTPDVKKLYDSVVVEERTAHSVKPVVFYDMIETLYPVGKRIELFARTDAPRQGWDVFGFEARREA